MSYTFTLLLSLLGNTEPLAGDAPNGRVLRLIAEDREQCGCRAQASLDEVTVGDPAGFKTCSNGVVWSLAIGTLSTEDGDCLVYGIEPITWCDFTEGATCSYSRTLQVYPSLVPPGQTPCTVYPDNGAGTVPTTSQVSYPISLTNFCVMDHEGTDLAPDALFQLILWSTNGSPASVLLKYNVHFNCSLCPDWQ